MKATVIHWAQREEVALAPYAAGLGLAGLAYLDTVLTTVHPSGQLDVALVMLGTFAVKAAIVWLQKRHPVPAA
jgi:hypothetical protein